MFVSSAKTLLFFFLLAKTERAFYIYFIFSWNNERTEERDSALNKCYEQNGEGRR